MRISEIAAYLKAGLANPEAGDPEITGIAGIKTAKAGDLTFLGSTAFLQFVPESQATALITREAQPQFKGPQILHKDPHFAYAKVALLFHKVDHGPKGVHPTAIIEEGVTLGKDVTIGAYSYVSRGSVIGDRVVLYPHVYIGQDVVIGADTVMHPQTVVYYGSRIGQRCLFHAGCVIGADGFGFAVSGGEICKIPQIGIVRIEDDVECGASVTIDRAANGETLVKRGCKFDDKVHIGHNVEVGEHCMFSAYGGVAGSSTIGDWVLMGGHSGVADHLHVVSRTRIGAKTGVIENIEKPGTYVGFPAEPAGDWKRGVVYMRHMKEHFRKIRIMEERLAQLEEKCKDMP
jgi:UDP-3-O-[3-hydroxymyristoyl] glucosamine N-acyltransferase